MGLWSIIKERKNTTTRRDLAIDFLDKLRSYIDGRGEDLKSYSWLIHRSNRFQLEMGSTGILGVYRPPFQNYQIKNFPIILNILPELRKEFEQRLMSSSRLIPLYANLLQESIVRYMGNLDDSLDKRNKEIRNPIIWLREGIREIIAFPIIIFSWLGVISEVTVKSITHTLIFRSIAAITMLIGLVSAIMGIALGWDPFLKLLEKYIK